jgi:hypothetical protein
MKWAIILIALFALGHNSYAGPAPELLMQQQIVLPPPSLTEQLDDALTDKCQEKIDFYNGRIDDNNNGFDVYNRFMLKKWQDRCINK